MFQLLLLFFYGFIQLAKAQDSSSLCPNVTGWTFNHESTTCFFLGDTLVNHDEAQAFCASKGGVLAEIHDMDQKNGAIDVTKGLFLPPWTGATRATDGKFIWPDGTGVFGYWYEGEPSQHGDCTVFRVPLNVNDSGLTTAPCSDIQYPLCTYRPKICEGVVTIQGESGTFTSPNYPNNYYNDLDCVWLLIAPVNTSFILFRLNSYDVDTPDDFVSVYEGNTTLISQRIHKYDDYKNTTDQMSAGPMMTVLFHTDSDNTQRGFNATFTAVSDLPDVHQTGESGEMQSPNYPNEYSNLVDQSYFIVGPPGTKITLVIDDFETESRFDVLTIYDGPSPSGLYLEQLSGIITVPYNITSTSENLSMRFTTDEQITKHGWHLKWTAK